MRSDVQPRESLRSFSLLVVLGPGARNDVCLYLFRLIDTTLLLDLDFRSAGYCVAMAWQMVL